MALKKPNWKEWKAKLKNVYRFQIVDEKSYDVKLVLELSRLNVLVVTGLLLAFFTLLNFLLIAYTPLKQYIPGYGSSSSKKEVIKMSIKAEELEENVKAHQKYITNLQNILNDKVVVDAVKSNLKKTTVDSGILSIKSRDEVHFVNEIEKGLKNAELMEAMIDAKTSILNNLLVSKPVSGALTSKFTSASPSITFAAKDNEEVKAVLSGTVIFVDNSIPNNAYIAVQSDNQLVFILKNNSQILKKTGNFVKEGESIAIAGKSNKASISTLELWYRGQAINAGKFIK